MLIENWDRAQRTITVLVYYIVNKNVKSVRVSLYFYACSLRIDSQGRYLEWKELLKIKMLLSI